MLLRFSRTGALPMTKVGDRLMVHPTGVTKLVDKLESEGLVRRQPNETDRRGTLARITPEGRRLADRATAAVARARFGVPLDDAELERLIAMVRRLRIAAGDL